MGGLSYEDALKTVTDTTQGIIDQSVISIECLDGIKHDFNIQDSGATFDAKTQTDRIWAIGHEGNYLKRAYDYYYAKMSGFNVDAGIQFPSDLSENISALIQESVSVVKREPSYAITSASVIFFNGKDGVHVKKEELKQAVEKVLSNLVAGATKYELSGYVISDPYTRIDLESIKISVISPATDA
ncbi:hypothetical protein SDC9_168449 [bioreactor metagenome]|uniref:YoaR-like putative peptidoglycan binding domain-containing protein n=1 Tax=bioreactor metagenome TaxID=1076179 RepID=A0A645G570_9ZZZZ